MAAPGSVSRVAALPLLGRLRELAVVSLVDATATPATPLIGTHSGAFHCDEALAIAMLRMLPKFHGHGILRSRNPALLEQCEIVVDVGATYEPDALRFDHHQRGFDTVLPPFETKLSSAGLVYKHFGREVLAEAAEACAPGALGDAPGLLELLYERVYRTFVEHVDAIDNGITVADGEPRYVVPSTLSSRVGRLNPRWNEDQSDLAANAAFQRAVLLTGTELLEVVEGLLHSWWPARSIVTEALRARGEVHSSGEVIQLPRACPWQSHIFDVEREVCPPGPEHPGVKYVLYQDSHGSWRVQAVPDAEGSFDSRKKLPAAWRGIRDENLDKLVGIDGCIFVHAAGFIGGHKTLDGAKKMAIDALSME